MKKYKLYYEDTNTKRYDCLGEFDTEERAMKEMDKYLIDKPPYYRIWTENNITTIDFGSWSRFFKIEVIQNDNS